MAGPANACQEFWHAMKDNIFVRQHPALPAARWPMTIPLGMHGDGGAFSKQDSLYIISWNSLIGQGSTASKRFLFTVFRKSEMVDGTLDAVFRVLAWSFNLMLEGKWPKKNYHGRAMANGGKDIAGGWRAALCQVRGDWAFYTEVFRFPAWNSAERMCWLCRASSTIRRLSWADSRPGAGWRGTRWSHETYLEFLRGAGIAIPILLVGIIGFRLECICIDTLHTVDQGLASHIIANVFWLYAVVRRVFGGDTQADCIAALFEHMKQWYKSDRSARSSKLQGKLTVERIRTSKGWPKLKSKAAATRHLAAYAVHLVQSFGTPEDREVLAIVQLLQKFYTIIASQSMFLTKEAKEALPELGRNLAILYSGLAAKSAAAHSKMWKMMPKLHLFVHLCEWQAVEIGNPRSFWTYADEDLVGLLCEVARSCHPATLAASALFKWLQVYYE